MNTTFVVNADDFGMSVDVNDGIVASHDRGIVTSTSVMTNMPHFQAIEDVSRRYRDLGVGLHICLSEGAPVSPVDRVRTLVDEDGRFYTRRVLFERMRMRAVDLQEVAHEARVQLDALTALGIAADHWNSHQYVHSHPKLLAVLKSVLAPDRVPCMRTHERAYVDSNGWLQNGRKLSLYRKLPMRLAKDVYFRVESWRARRNGFRLPDAQLTRVPFNADYEVLTENAAKHANNGVFEWICHPSLARRPSDSKAMDRPHELALLTRPNLRQELHGSGIRLANFKGAFAIGR